MGVPELITRMQEIYRQAEAQLQHVEPLQRSGAAWTGTAKGLADTSVLLRQAGGQIAPGWPDEVGALYTERLGKSAQTVQMWQDTLAAADLPATVNELAEAIGTTVDGVRELWNTFVQAIGQLGIEGIDAAGVEAALQGIVDQALALLEELDQLFAEAAAKVAEAADGTAWDGPAATGGGAGGAGGDAPASAGDAAPMSAAAGGGGVPGSAGGGGAPAAVEPAGGPGLAGVGAPSPAGLSGGLPPISAITPSPSVGLPPLPALAGGGIAPIGGSVPPLGSGIAPIGSGVSPAGGGSVSPILGHGAAGAAGGQIPRAGRRITGAPPLASGGPPAGPGGPASATSGATGGSSRFFPPVGGMGHGGGRHDGDVRPGDEKSAYQARPLPAVPGVPPALRGRAGALDATPDFLTGSRHEETEPAEPLREELWEAKRPSNPFRGGR